MFESPVVHRNYHPSPLPIRSLRFSDSTGRRSRSAGGRDENCPGSSNADRQQQQQLHQVESSPNKFSDRTVQLLIGSKVSSSVPGRTSSCAKERRATAPVIEFDEELLADLLERGDATERDNKVTTRRSKSAQSLERNRSKSNNSRTLKRL